MATYRALLQLIAGIINFCDNDLQDMEKSGPYIYFMNTKPDVDKLRLNAIIFLRQYFDIQCKAFPEECRLLLQQTSSHKALIPEAELAEQESTNFWT